MTPIADRHAPTLLTSTLVGVPMLGLAGAGLSLGALIAARAWALGPTAALTALALATLTTVPYLLLVLWVDRHEAEPVPLLGLALAWGAVNAAIASMHGAAWASYAFGAAADGWASGLAAPVIEEGLKALPLVALLLIARGELDGVLDGVIYGAMVGLGFAWFENFLYYLLATSTGLADAFELAWLRGVLCGLGSHATFSGIVGAGVGLHRALRSRPSRHAAIPVALALAIGAHALWNLAAPDLLAHDPDRMHRLLVTAPLTVAALQGPFLLLVGALVVLEWRHQDELIVAFLGQEPPDILHTGELSHLVPARRRVGRELRALFTGGPAAFLRHRRLSDGLVRLAFARWHHLHDEVPWHADADPEIAGLRRRVRAERARGTTL
jgi:RsiW-degrading membrane proteinase PrsW (M82 family)